MYCVKCGVRLSDAERVCPLCGTEVIHPEHLSLGGTPLYPVRRAERKRMNRPFLLLVLSVVLAVLAIQLLTFDIRFGGISWSLYAVGGLVFFYVAAILPLWFKRPNPVIFVPVDFAAAGLFLLLVCLMTGGDWFLPFALPILAGAAIITVTVVTLSYYVRRGYFYIFGGATVALGLLCLLVEERVYSCFSQSAFYFWSLYPLVGFTVFGLFLILIGIVHPLKERIEKKFFI